MGLKVGGRGSISKIRSERGLHTNDLVVGRERFRIIPHGLRTDFTEIDHVKTSRRGRGLEKNPYRFRNQYWRNISGRGRRVRTRVLRSVPQLRLSQGVFERCTFIRKRRFLGVDPIVGTTFRSSLSYLFQSTHSFRSIRGSYTHSCPN